MPKTVKPIRKQRLSPRFELFCQIYTNPNRKEFSDAGLAWQTVNDSKFPGTKKLSVKLYCKHRGEDYLANPIIKERVKELLTKHMKGVTYNIDTIMEMLQVHIDSENPSEALAAKKELFSQWHNITKLQVINGFGMEVEELDKISTEELVARMIDLIKQSGVDTSTLLSNTKALEAPITIEENS